MRLFLALTLVICARAHPPAGTWIGRHTGQSCDEDQCAHPSMILKDGEKTAALKVDRQVLTEESWVKVTWTNTTAWSSDYIGLFFADITEQYWFDGDTPIKYKRIPEKARSLRFLVKNYRQPVRFAMVRPATNRPSTKYAQPYFTVVGKSPEITFENPNEPMHGHLMLSTSDGVEHVHLVWTQKECGGMVKWGTSSGSYTESSTVDECHTYTREDMCDLEDSPAGGKGWMDPGFFHTATLHALEPATRYYYIYGPGQGKGGFSKEASFVSPKVPGSPTVMIGLGDSGSVQQDGSQQHSWDWQGRGQVPTLDIYRGIANEDADFVLHVGDHSYSVGYMWEWENYMSQIEPIAQKMPYQAVIGNHEMAYHGSFAEGTDSGGECGVPYAAQFPYAAQTHHQGVSPTKGQYTRRQPWYSFEYGNVHVTVMSTEHDWNVTSDQYKFIAEDLAKVDRAVRPWLVFTGHRPMYIADIYDSDQLEAQDLRDVYEPLLKEFKVDLALWGHFHGYQSTCPVFNETCTEGGTTHQVIGMSGYEMNNGAKTNIKDPIPSWIETATNDHYGYVRYNFTNAESLHIEFISASHPVHSFWIHK